jgi:TolB-like protein/cytochrome c-type biogenesis protein CcmH/NrfG
MPDVRQQPDASAIPAGTIQSHLETVLQSPVLAGSERLRKFLRFLVEKTLKGEADQLKEYTVGVEVFERGPDYDPRIDPTVRVSAGKLRDRLREYYLTDGRDALLRIDLPKGTYVPAFRLQAVPALENRPVARDRGTQRKWIFAAVLLLAVVSVAVASHLLWRAPPAVPAVASSLQPRSLAVLPFSNLSPEAKEEYFSDGLTEELTNVLARVGGLRVVARTSAFQFKGKGSDVRQIGKTLNVGAVLEGSIQKSGSKLHVTAQLVGTTDGYHLWSGSYDRDAKDVFAVEEEIAQAITIALKIQLRPGQERIPFKPATENLEAYRLYLTGRFYWNKGYPEALRTAVEYYKQATSADPKFAAAWAGMANAYTYYSIYGYDLPSRGQARAAAEKALAIDPASTEALSALARVKAQYDWDWPEAERLFRRTQELNANDATAHQFYANTYLMPLGRLNEAQAELRRALELDPLSPLVNSALATNYYFMRQYDKAIEVQKKTIELDPGFAMGYLYLGYYYAENSMFPEATTVLERQPKQLWEGPNLGVQAYAYGKWGKPEEAYKLLEKWKASKPGEPSREVTAVYFYLGAKDYDQMFEWLEKAVEHRWYWATYLKVRPIFDPVRSDPRYHALLRKMRIPE